jgi:adenosylcobinamide kinase / adenosylcobinamide-phosphate guanylyltransferase
MSALPRSLLVLGGARSGKSRYALELAENSGKTPVLIATAAAGDDEMAERIAKHRAERKPHWQVIEEEIDLAGALLREARQDHIVVVDCLTLWLTNLMLKGADVEAAGENLVRTLDVLEAPVIFVSNEVGLGIVPENTLARRFRDAQGTLNRELASACEAVVFIAAGLPLRLKPSDTDLRP